MNKTTIRRFITAGFLSTSFMLAPYSSVWAEEEKESGDEHCAECGVVSAIKAAEEGGSSGLGAAAGAVAGGVAGNQIGQTDTAKSTIGSTASTILGMVGGAVTGHFAEKAATTATTWAVTVNMDAGGAPRIITTTTNPQVAIGDHVRISGNSLLPYKTHED